jgi:hypothetical protein
VLEQIIYATVDADVDVLGFFEKCGGRREREKREVNASLLQYFQYTVDNRS